MLRNVAMAAALAGAVVLAAPVLADDIADGVALLPGAVEDVRVAGTWSRGDETGVYRILIARTGGNAVSARLFVQWVAYLPDGRSVLQDSMEITELADLGIDIVDYISESDTDGLTVYIQADNPEIGGADTFELFVFAPGDYLFDEATN